MNQQEMIEGREAELVDVLEFFRELVVDVERNGKAFSLDEIIDQLVRGEHRR